MSRPNYLFDIHRNNENELVKKIKQIANGLDYLTRLIGHGEAVAPTSTQDLRAYSLFVKEQLENLTQLVKNVESGADRALIADQVDQFHQSCQTALEQIDAMKTLPSLDAQHVALEEHLEGFTALEQQVRQNLSSDDLLTCLNTSKDLLEGINGSIASALENPLVQVARCATKGAVVAETLTGPSARPGL